MREGDQRRRGEGALTKYTRKLLEKIQAKVNKKQAYLLANGQPHTTI